MESKIEFRLWNWSNRRNKRRYNIQVSIWLK